MGSGFTSLGFLKFRSPTRALVLDLRLGGSHREDFFEDSSGSRFTGLDSFLFTQLRFGWRGYRGSATKVVAHYTVGVLAGFDHSARISVAGFSLQDNAWTGGLFGDLGATYLVTPHIGLGALGAGTLTYSAGTTEQQATGAKVHSWEVGGTAVSASLVATLFF